MTDLTLPGLSGRNPLGYLAALGVLDVLTRQHPERRPRLGWTESLQPVANVSWDESTQSTPLLEDVVWDVVTDQRTWRASTLLNLDTDDIKPDLETLRSWFVSIEEFGNEADKSLIVALVAENAVAGSGNEAKPTHLHFTAGQQRFLRMVRELRDEVTDADICEALEGPWCYQSPLPSFGWDARGRRIYAVSGVNPATEKQLSVPGAEWLALLGLRFFPVVNGGGSLLTTGCNGSWKRGSFRWPIWDGALQAGAISSLIASRHLAADPALSAEALHALGIREIVTAPIRRNAQGGYGSFGPPTSSATTSPAPLSSLLRRATGQRARRK